MLNHIPTSNPRGTQLTPINRMADYSYLFKYIIVGDTNVGKSSLMLQFIDARFSGSLDPTVGVEFGSRVTKIDDSSIKLQIWDTAGQESFKSITKSYFRGAIGALLVFDTTSRESFGSVGRWLEDIRAGTSKNISIVLVGNKVDLVEKRKVTREEGEKFAVDNGLIYYEASAKTGEGVREAFEGLCGEVVRSIQSGRINPANEFGIKMGTVGRLQTPKKGEGGSGCC